MSTYHRILLATDFTEASNPAVEKGLELAKDNQAELVVAYAYEPPNSSQAAAVSPSAYDEWNENLRARAKTKIQPIVEEARSRGVIARALVLTGEPELAIPEAARNESADLIVVGTHGHTGVSRFFLGSVAARVISTAPCPVLAVRAA